MYEVSDHLLRPTRFSPSCIQSTCGNRRCLCRATFRSTARGGQPGALPARRHVRGASAGRTRLGAREQRAAGPLRCAASPPLRRCSHAAMQAFGCFRSWPCEDFRACLENVGPTHRRGEPEIESWHGRWRCKPRFPDCKGKPSGARRKDLRMTLRGLSFKSIN